MSQDASPFPLAPRVIRVAYQVEERPGRWLLDEDAMPETPLHDLVLRLLCLVFEAWIKRTNRNAHVARNLACRWDPEDARVGVDPDLALLEPYARSVATLGQLRTWEPEHVPPRLAIEVVSASTADKDYLEIAPRYARLGTREVWVFDPLLLGPKETGGPFLLAGWRWNGTEIERVYTGEGPAFSEELQAWFVVTEGGQRLRVAEEAAGGALWPTGEEAERGAREAAVAELAALREEMAGKG